MPARSVAQWKYMKAVASGSVKATGLSKAKAAEFTKGQSPKGLPRKKGK